MGTCPIGLQVSTAWRLEGGQLVREGQFKRSVGLKMETALANYVHTQKNIKVWMVPNVDAFYLLSNSEHGWRSVRIIGFWPNPEME
jgi:hypothetical protein